MFGLWLPEPSLYTIEDDSMMAHSLHGLNQVLVVFLRHLATDAYVIMYGDMLGR